MARHASPAYHRIVVPLAGDGDAAVTVACLLAAEGGAEISAVAPIEVPTELPLDAHMPAEAAAAAALGVRARAVGGRYGVVVEPVVVRTRAAGEAIVTAAREHHAEIVVVALSAKPSGRRTRVDATTDYVLHHAPCRVSLVAEPAA